MEGLGTDSELFHEVFIEGPLEALISQCDAITATSLVGLSNSLLQSARVSATLCTSQPFGLPCVLHSHPMKKPWEYGEDLPICCECMLTPLDRFSSDAMMTNVISEQRADSNGDWIVMVGLEWKWELVNVYTCHRIPLPSVTQFEATKSSLAFMEDDHPLTLQKIVICDVPTTAGEYTDFSLVAVFDYKIFVLEGNAPNGWIVLENQFEHFSKYCDAIIHNDLVLAIATNGSVYAWDPERFGKISSLYSVLALLFFDVS
jgi:hypothetical protein